MYREMYLNDDKNQGCQTNFQKMYVGRIKAIYFLTKFLVTFGKTLLIYYYSS